MDHAEARAAVIREAMSWIRTPFHHEGRVKGAGVDCLMLLAEVYERAGVVGHITVPHYPPDWFMHRDAERYLEGLAGYAQEIPGPPEPADIALYKLEGGRCFFHGTIVVEWPGRLIHASGMVGFVTLGSAEQWPLRDRPVKFFSPFRGA